MAFTPSRSPVPHLPLHASSIFAGTNKFQYPFGFSVTFVFRTQFLLELSLLFSLFLSNSWLYRIKPSVTHEPFKPRVPNHGKLLSEFNPSNSSATPTQLRWKPVDIPESPTDFVDGLFTICGAGSSFLRYGYAIHM